MSGDLCGPSTPSRRERSLSNLETPTKVDVVRTDAAMSEQQTAGSLRDAWATLCSCLNLPAIKKDRQVLEALELHYSTLVYSCDGDTCIRSLDGASGGSMRVRSRFLDAHCPGMSRAEQVRQIGDIASSIQSYWHESRTNICAQLTLGSKAGVVSIAAVVPTPHTGSADAGQCRKRVQDGAGEHVPRFCAEYLHPRELSQAQSKKQKVEDTPADSSEWVLGDSPIVGAAATLDMKRVCLNVYSTLKGWLKTGRNGSHPAPLVWNGEYIKHMAKLKASKRKRAAGQAASDDQYKWGSLASELCIVSKSSIYRWLADLRGERLQAPARAGRPSIDACQYQAMFSDLLSWGEAICRRRRQQGLATHYGDLADIILEEADFKDEVISRLLSIRTNKVSDGKRLFELLGIGEVDAELDEAAAGHAKVLAHVKRLLEHMGFGWKPILRESVRSISLKLPWTIKFAKWYLEYTTEPQTDTFLYWLDESFIYEGEGESGTIVEPALARDGSVVMEELGTFRRIGLLDGLAVFWQRLQPSSAWQSDDISVLDQAAADPNNWTVVKRGDDWYALRGCKLPVGTYVWPNQKPGEDGKAEQKKEKVPKYAECDRGNMNANRFETWLVEMLDTFQHMSECKSAECLAKALDRPVDRLGALPLLLGRSGILLMDGASYHKRTNPDYVARSGQGSLFGIGERGRHDAGSGWRPGTCIWWLYLSQFAAPKQSYEQTKDSLGLAELEYLEHLEGLPVHALRNMVDSEAERQRFNVKKLADLSGMSVMFTPPHVGKFLNPVELVWSLTKSSYRALPAPARSNEEGAMTAIRRILHRLEGRDQIIGNLCLPGLRFAFAVCSAFYHRNQVEYGGKRVLFQDLEEAILDLSQCARGDWTGAADVRTGDDELFARHAIDAIDMHAAPRGLSTCSFPVNILHRERSLRRFKLCEGVADVGLLPLEAISASCPAAPTSDLDAFDQPMCLEVLPPATAADGADLDLSSAEETQETRAQPASRRLRRAVSTVKRTSGVDANRVRLAAVSRLLRTSRIRCTCGVPIHSDKCFLWSHSSPRRLRQPGSDVGVSAADWEFVKHMKAK